MPEPAARERGGRPPNASGLGAQFFSLSHNWAMVALAAGVATLDWAAAGGKLLLYGDATAHLMMARRMVDSLTPGLSQWGSVWLPLPHLLDATLIRVPGFWRSGMAGSLVSLACFVLATWLLHRLVKRELGPLAAGWAAACFCLNPGLLYLSVTPMDESVYLAAFVGLVDQCSRYARRSTRRRARGMTPPWGTAWAAGGFAVAAAMTRYDGWFTMPFALLVLVIAALRAHAPESAAAPSGNAKAGMPTALVTRRGEAWGAAWRFALAGGSGPAAWLLYNWFYYDDWLEFLRGKYSAHQIYVNALRRGGAPYPGDHAWLVAFRYFLKAARGDCGTLLLLLGLGGALALVGRAVTRKRTLAPALWLLWLPLPWYLWAMWSGNVPIFVPQYWPHGYYNLRYGLQLLPAACVFSALAVGLLAAWASRHAGAARAPRIHHAALLLLGLAVAAVYVAMLRAPGPPVYAEAVHNAPARMRMEQELASALADRRAGQRVLMYVGEYPGALADDNIPLREVIEESNMLAWQDALGAPQRYVDWVVLEQRTQIDKLINRAALRQYFEPVASIEVTGQPEITVYRRNQP